MSEVWNLNLHHTEKIVLLALADNANDEGHCWPSVNTLVSKCGLSERSIQASVMRLVEFGHLTRTERTGRSTIYRVTPAAGAPPQTVHPAAAAPTPAGPAPPPPQTVHPTPANGAPRTIREPSFEPPRNRQVRGAARPPPRKRCPEDFQITEELRAWASTNAPDVDITTETEGFRDWEFKSARTDWPATWRGWMRRAQAERPGKPMARKSITTAPVKTKTAEEWEAIERARGETHA